MTVDCPLPDNMAAIALQMQETALQAETELYAAELALAASLNRPSWVVDLTTSVTGIPSNAEVNLFQQGGTYVERFNNCGVEVKTFGQIRLPFAGLWQVGFSLNMSASGAVDDNTYREFVLAHARQTSASALGYTEIWRETSDLFESNTGVGTDGVVIAEFSVQARDLILVFVNHGNTSSTITVPNNPFPRFWGVLLSTTDQVKVT